MSDQIDQMEQRDVEIDGLEKLVDSGVRLDAGTLAAVKDRYEKVRDVMSSLVADLVGMVPERATVSEDQP